VLVAGVGEPVAPAAGDGVGPGLLVLADVPLTRGGTATGSRPPPAEPDVAVAPGGAPDSRHGEELEQPMGSGADPARGEPSPRNPA
jgi:hypothetical protein